MSTPLWDDLVQQYGVKGALQRKLVQFGGLNAPAAADACGRTLPTVGAIFEELVRQGEADWKTPGNHLWIVHKTATAATAAPVVQSKGRRKPVPLKTDECVDEVQRNLLDPLARVSQMATKAERALRRNGVEVVRVTASFGENISCLTPAKVKLRLQINDNRDQRLYLWCDAVKGYEVCYGVGFPGSSWGWFKGLSNATKVLYEKLETSNAVNPRRKR